MKARYKLSEKWDALALVVAVPLLVMSYHVFQFFEHDPLIVRIGLALSFDILLVVLFMLINDDLVKKQPAALATCWGCVTILMCFQVYVNTWVYWGDVSWIRALISGAIFPLLVAPISYISSLRKVEEVKIEEREQRKQLKKRSKNVEVQDDSATTYKKYVPQPSAQHNEKDWKGEVVPREMVEAANDIKQFRGARNWRSVKRWHGGQS